MTPTAYFVKLDGLPGAGDRSQRLLCVAGDGPQSVGRVDGIYAEPSKKFGLAHAMLLSMATEGAAQWNGESVGWFDADAAVAAASDVGAFARARLAAC